MSKELTVTKDLDNKTLTLEREFDATIDKVWKAYADKETFEKWWGPKGFETTAKEFNFAPGGRVHYDMKCVDENQPEWFGKSSWGMMLIETVDAPNSFSYTDYFTDESGTLNQEMPSLKITNTFTEQKGVTKLTSISHADSAEQIEQLIQMGMVDGFTSQLIKLDSLLAE
ncbi:MAG: activator of Hsp90 ATPase 1 family protein [Candidatus Saccharibacteria bacterium]|nr:activator of Hsp90 ATPase 1 family protein [Candidatus Saccharibacteria bacterium]